MSQTNEPEPEGELILERFGVKTSRGSKIHFISAESLFITICGKYIGTHPIEIRLVRNGKFIKKKSQCGNCRQQLNRLAKKGGKVRLLRVGEQELS